MLSRACVVLIYLVLFFLYCYFIFYFLLLIGLEAHYLFWPNPKHAPRPTPVCIQANRLRPSLFPHTNGSVIKGPTSHCVFFHLPWAWPAKAHVLPLSSAQRSANLTPMPAALSFLSRVRDLQKPTAQQPSPPLQHATAPTRTPHAAMHTQASTQLVASAHAAPACDTPMPTKSAADLARKLPCQHAHSDSPCLPP